MCLKVSHLVRLKYLHTARLLPDFLRHALLIHKNVSIQRKLEVRCKWSAEAIGIQSSVATGQPSVCSQNFNLFDLCCRIYSYTHRPDLDMDTSTRVRRLRRLRSLWRLRSSADCDQTWTWRQRDIDQTQKTLETQEIVETWSRETVERQKLERLPQGLGLGNPETWTNEWMCMRCVQYRVARSAQRSTHECTCTHALHRSFVLRSSSHFVGDVPSCAIRVWWLVFLWYRFCSLCRLRSEWQNFSWQGFHFQTYLSTVRRCVAMLQAVLGCVRRTSTSLTFLALVLWSVTRWRKQKLARLERMFHE